jgi:hypothetical protein
MFYFISDHKLYTAILSAITGIPWTNLSFIQDFFCLENYLHTSISKVQATGYNMKAWGGAGLQFHAFMSAIGVHDVQKVTLSLIYLFYYTRIF